MAIDPIVVTPEHCTVTSYAAQRLGAVPSITFTYADTNDLLEDTVEVSEIADEGGFLTLVVPSWASRTDLVGRMCYTLDPKTAIGTVTAMDVPGHVRLDAAYDGAVTLTAVTTPVRNANGIVAHERAAGGHEWEIVLPMAGATAARVQQLNLSAMATLVTLALAELGDTTTTPSQVQAAVIAMALAGNDLDAILTREGEQIEQERRAGTLVGAVYREMPR